MTRRPEPDGRKHPAAIIVTIAMVLVLLPAGWLSWALAAAGQPGSTALAWLTSGL